MLNLNLGHELDQVPLFETQVWLLSLELGFALILHLVVSLDLIMMRHQRRQWLRVSVLNDPMVLERIDKKLIRSVVSLLCVSV